MKKIFKGYSPWGFLGFKYANTENQEPPKYLTGYTPVKKIHKAASVGDITQVQRMLEFGDIDVNLTDRKKRTALHYACAHGQSEMVTLLLWYGCNIEARDRDKSTGLIKATQRQHEECVMILLKSGADSNVIDVYQNTALHYTVYNNNTAIAARLLAFKANTEIKAKNGYTPLILAVLENNQEMVGLLLQASADINALDNHKRSPLIHAVIAKSKDMISLLLQQGADASLVDVYGATAQSYTVFETFQVLSKGSSSNRLEQATEEDEHNSDAKDDCTPCTHLPAEEEKPDAADKLGSVTHKPRNSKPTREEDRQSFSSKEDMESRSVPLEESKHQAAILLGKEENALIPELPARVSNEPGANNSDPTEKENAKDELVSLLAPLEENKLQMKEISVTGIAELQTDVKLERQGVLEHEEKGLETCQENSLEAAESPDFYSILRFSTNPDLSGPENSARKDECNFDTKDKDKLKKHPLAQRASQRQAKQMGPPPLQLQEQGQQPETSDGEDRSEHLRSANGRVLRGMLVEGEKLEGKDTAQLVMNKLSSKDREICEAVKINVQHKEDWPRDNSSDKTALRPASANLACGVLDYEDREGAAARVSAVLQTFCRLKEGSLGDVFPSPASSWVVENGGQPITKFPLMKNKSDCENNKSKTEESLHKSNEKSSKTTGSRKIKGKHPGTGTGEKLKGLELKSQMIRHMPESGESKGLSDSKERNHVSEIKSWGDSTLCDICKKNKDPRDLTQKPLHSWEAARTEGTASASGGRAAFADEGLQDSLSDSELHILEEEILAWEKVHLENESVSENLPNKYEAISYDAAAQKGKYLENKCTGAESDFEVTPQSEQKSLDGSENTWLQKYKVLLKTCPQTQNTSADLTRPAHPPSQKESKQSNPPPLHLEKLSEDSDISKKCDGECEPVHLEVPSVKESLSLQTCQGVIKSQTKAASEEVSKWPSPELEASENACLLVSDYNDNGLIVKRRSGRTGKLFPAEEDIFAKLTKRQAKEEHKMENQVNEVNKAEETNSRSQPSATAPRNDSSSLLKLWDIIHSYEKLTKLKNSHYELLTRKLENMENKASGRQREQAEITKIKSWLQHKGVEQEELCTLRFPLKQDEKQENAESTCQQKKGHLGWKEEQCGENVEWIQHPEVRAVVTNVKPTENDLRQLQRAQDGLSQTVQGSEKTQATLQRLEVRLSELKITLKEQSEKIEKIQNELLHEGLIFDDETKKLIQQGQFLEYTLEKQMDKNEELMTELTGFKKLFEETEKKLNKHEGRELGGPGDLKTSPFDMHIPISTLRHEFYKLKENWETTYYNCLHMVVKLQFIEQELIAIKTEQKYGHLLKNHKNLEEVVLRFRSWMREHMTQSRDQNTEDLRDTNDETMAQMELRVTNLESQLATRGAQQCLRKGLLKSEQRHDRAFENRAE